VRSCLDVALPAERTAVCGVSASGELALAMGLRHPGVYGGVFYASPGGGYRPPARMPSPLPRTYLVAGTLEPWFLENATEFPLMVDWAFGR
jgi:pimeloyl-ACP methyl ester carboxylesterase